MLAGGGALTSVNKFGRNEDVDATPEDIWDGGGTWVAPTAARVHAIVSTDAGDDGNPPGVGARTVQVYGLTSWDADETSEVITLNGAGAENTTNSYVIIHRMKVLTAGTSGPNVGVITATAATDSTVTAQIAAGEGQTQMAIYGVPSTQIAYMTQYYFGVNRATAGSYNGIIQVNPEPGDNAATYITKHLIGSSGHFAHEFKPPIKFPGPCIIKARADVTNINSDISAGFDLILK